MFVNMGWCQFSLWLKINGQKLWIIAKWSECLWRIILNLKIMWNKTKMIWVDFKGGWYRVKLIISCEMIWNLAKVMWLTVAWTECK